MPGVEAVVDVNVVAAAAPERETREAAALWAKAWKAGLGGADPEPIMARYAPTAVHFTEPFREPSRVPPDVRAYVERVLGEEEDPRVWMGEPIVDGDRAAIPWWASLREGGADATLAGHLDPAVRRRRPRDRAVGRLEPAR